MPVMKAPMFIVNEEFRTKKFKGNTDALVSMVMYLL